jgi:hypothetical protein
MGASGRGATVPGPDDITMLIDVNTGKTLVWHAMKGYTYFVLTYVTR